MILKQYCFSKTISETLQNACTVCCFFFFCLLQVIHMVVAQLFKHSSTFSLCSVDELGTLKWTDLGELLLEHGEAFCWYLYNQQDVHLFMLNQSKQTAYSHCKTLSGVNSISMHLGWQVRTNTSSFSKKSEREKKKKFISLLVSLLHSKPRAASSLSRPWPPRCVVVALQAEAG